MRRIVPSTSIPRIKKARSQCGGAAPYMLPRYALSARFAAGRLAPGWSVISRQQTRKVLECLGVNRRIDSIRWGLTPLRWRGRIFDVFLPAVDHLTRLVDAIAYLLEKFGLHG
jgi:hypothetical protein